jgi:raffinose/stachyose/melibiose transport system substrate-binding protein
MRRVLLVALLALFAGCGAPGEDASDDGGSAERSAKKIDVAAAGPVTLTVWDQEVRGGQRRQIEQLNEAFQQKYPNVTIKRVAKSTTDLNTTLKLAVSSDEAPDVVQANQGRSVMGTLVKGGLLIPLDDYAEAYGWADRYAPVLLDLNRFSSDGSTFGDGDLYGLSQMGEIVGVFYNRDKVPDPPGTFAELESQLAEAKSAGDVAISFGNLDKWPGIHEFQAVQNVFSPPDQVRDFVFAREGASFTTPENEDAAAKLQEWAEKGYFGKPDEYNSVSEPDIGVQFAKGKGALLIAGNWQAATVREGLGKNGIFFNMPPGESGNPTNIGATSFPMHISAKTKNPDLAAAYLDWIAGPDAAKELVATQQIPAATDATVEMGDPLGQQVKDGWDELVEGGGLTLFHDWSSPTMLQTIGQSFQEMLAGRTSPQDVIGRVQSDWEEYHQELAGG